MKLHTSVSGGDRLGDKLRQIRERLEKNKGVLIGVPAGLGDYAEGAPLAVIAAVHEFGTTIKHPGGTSYGYASEKDAIAGKSRFMKSGTGFMQTGVTGAHDIVIPERSFLRVPLRQNKDKFVKMFRSMIPKVVKGELTMQAVMVRLGGQGVRVSVEAIDSGIDPENAPSTVAKKGSSKPLSDSGRLRQSITFIVED
ncbi:MAG: hypothetical protein KKC55_17585 [Gammaproteobacteria bacterium]|uniref:Putative structural protein n=1 Tax=viral metagenome TaxID=1070528 RepID=A0A6M3M3T6_9ZZZZ|nr:hypothetical protein [Gammaproteobacteria bacterium]